ncbi:hypothetical protein [Photobacterium profundum]|uniref:Uncharacterized protein n=1 Tax=Photobacterium profundum (strain SS9) TaxID=298386 RepID=Q6LRW8_PHOPR|nr:hypothetical protein [Photobacterium profundum]CAG19958.1 hypothetical protein PBPRA1547 [Photobacterium profundum SS9]
MSTVTIKDIPYRLPKTTREQLTKLAKITSIPNNLLVGAGEKEVEAICYMILYRHLNQHLRIKAMTSIRSVKKKALMGELIKRVLDTTFVNPQWGIWSLTNSELNADIELHTHLTSIAGTLGFGASVSSGKDMLNKIKHEKTISRKNWITLIIWGCIYFNIRELKKATKEKDHRSTLNTSRFF